MSHRAPKATIEELSSDDEGSFDDDTDLPLPSRPLPDYGTRGPLLQAIDDDDDPTYHPSAPVASQRAVPSPSPSGLTDLNMNPNMTRFGSPSPLQQRGVPTVSDLTPYKKWTCLYPISIDAKRPYHAGERRIALEDSVWWPLSKDIADASSRLGLGTLHEVQKCHPRDWANPGRVRVQWKKEGGGFVNPRIRTKKQLMVAIAAYIQAVKPELVPQPESIAKPGAKQRQPKPSANKSSAGPSSAAAAAKSKQKAKAQEIENKLSNVSPTDTFAALGTFAHNPPSPLPALAVRVSAYSPALPAGVLIDALKAGMNAAGDGPGGPGGPPVGGGGGKGKRKVIRVRG